MLPNLDQHYVIHHWKVGVKKPAKVVKNNHVQREVLPALRLRSDPLSDSLGYKMEMRSI